MVDSEEDDDDYLAASMTSQRTVCSDAFDFLFDSQNLNPDTIQVIGTRFLILNHFEVRKSVYFILFRIIIMVPSGI